MPTCSTPLNNDASSPYWRELGLGLLLFVATVFAYSPALRGGLLIDDVSHVTTPALRSLSGLWRIWSEVGATHQYYPVLHTAFWLEHRLWGDSLLGYHLANVLLHAGSACLFVVLLRRLALAGAWLAGFIFALHPVCVESVAWISEQKNTLSTFLCLAAVLLYLHFDQARQKRDYGLALALFILSVLSKSATVTAPAVILVIFWWKRGRLEWKRDILPLIPWLVLGLAAILPVASLERKNCAVFASDFFLSLLERGLLAGRAFWFYLWKLVWPSDLFFIYPRWTPDIHSIRQYLFPTSAILLLVAAGFLARRRRGPLATLLIFGGTLFPVLGFFNVFWFVLSFVGDHLQYLSSLALIAAFTTLLLRLADSLAATFHRAVLISTAILPVALGLLTWTQSAMYRNAETLYRTTLSHNPSCWIAHYNLGEELNRGLGHRAEVIGEWETALRYRPAYTEAHSNLACLLAEDPARVPEAIAHFETALQLKPDFAEAHSNLASLLANDSNRIPEAIVHFQTALRQDSNSAETHNNFGNLLVDLPGRLPEGIAEIETALRLQPDYAEAHWNLGLALSQFPERQREAIAHVERALLLKPDLEGAQQLLDHLRDVRQQASAPSSAK